MFQVVDLEPAYTVTFDPDSDTMEDESDASPVSTYLLTSYLVT